MFSGLVESLRCVRDHEPSGLVAVAAETFERDIVRGSLGCPVCRAEYGIANAVADFRSGAEGPPPPPAKTRVAEELALRAGALLGLADARGLAVLAGAWSAAAPELAAIAEPVHVLAVDAAPGVASGAGVSLARTAGEIPLRAGTARGIALDAAHSGDRYLASAAAALSARGRLVAPVTCALPAGFSELARDASDWVAEKDAVATVVPLTRARGQPPSPPPV